MRIATPNVRHWTLVSLAALFGLVHAVVGAPVLGGAHSPGVSDPRSPSIAPSSPEEDQMPPMHPRMLHGPTRALALAVDLTERSPAQWAPRGSEVFSAVGHADVAYSHARQAQKHYDAGDRWLASVTPTAQPRPSAPPSDLKRKRAQEAPGRLQSSSFTRAPHGAAHGHPPAFELPATRDALRRRVDRLEASVDLTRHAYASGVRDVRRLQRRCGDAESLMERLHASLASRPEALAERCAPAGHGGGVDSHPLSGLVPSSSSFSSSSSSSPPPYLHTTTIAHQRPRLSLDLGLEAPPPLLSPGATRHDLDVAFGSPPKSHTPSSSSSTHRTG